MSSTPEDEVERRLKNWARWKLAGGELSRSVIERASSSGGFSFGSGRSGGYRETSVPILSGEALDTDSAINAIDPQQRFALRGWYLGILPNGSRMSGLWTQVDLAHRMHYPLRTFERLLADARAAVVNLLLVRRKMRRVG